MLSSLFAYGFIELTTTQLIQLKEISKKYKAETTLNVTEGIITNHLKTNEIGKDFQATIRTSEGIVSVNRKNQDIYKLTLINVNKSEYSRVIEIPMNNENDDQIQVNKDIEKGNNIKENIDENINEDINMEKEIYNELIITDP